MIKKFFLNYLKINNENINQRIDNFLFRNFKYLSKNKIYSLIRKGNIRVNKKRISHKYKLNKNDIIRLPLIELKDVNKNNVIFLNKNEIIFFENRIIYEDNYLIVINKPSGISVHKGTNILFNIIDIYRYLRPDIKYLDLIHRIDKYTSGILLISKCKYFLISLNKYFVEKKIIKKYILLVYGLWSKNINLMESFIIKKFRRSFVIFNKIKNSKFSKTYFKILYKIGNFTLLKAYPITGCNHQIRLHCSFLGYPILGDKIYNHLNFLNNFKLKINNRLFLHSYFISFFHPFLKKNIEFKIKLDNELCYILKLLNKKFKRIKYNGCTKK